ncbi:MAG TPA: RagB/SusD family nutrient uptake outer membrane protein [Pedobacter sp.]|nr:RagB/SusD family nutrient uptake outer membrane protein [Pedobacter sp.]
MKKLNILLLLTVLFSASCKKVLETEPQANISDEAVIVDKKSAQAALVGAYDALQGQVGSNIVSLELAADNVVNFNAQNRVVADKTASGAGGGFSTYYVIINRANFILSKVPQLNDALIPVADKNQILGEAYFLRGLSYFDLAKTYGGVQIVLEPATNANAHKGVRRSTRDQTYAQALSDLNSAENLLSATVNRNRANKFTAYALKAKLYLYTQKWDLAEEFATKSIISNNFELVKPYATFFTSKNTKESIFEIAFSTADKSSFYTNWRSPEQGGRHDYIPERGFVGKILDPNLGGSRKSLLFQTPQGVYDLIQYGNQDGTSSIFVLRIAEQYLIRAEARAHKAVPDLQGAVEDLNKIKSRADVPELVFTPELSAADVLLAIENERRFELPFEGHRFLDIVRTGRAAAVFGAVNVNLKNPNFWIFPIPQSEIINDPDLSGDQNPDY